MKKMSNELVYCVGCKGKVGVQGELVEVVYHTNRGVKYGLKGVCVKGHKLSIMKRKSE